MKRILAKLRNTSKKFIGSSPKNAAHFLLIPELLYSPPNCAIIKAYLAEGYLVDVYSPGSLSEMTTYGNQVNTFTVSYTWVWIFKHILSLRWFKYEWISGTSEDPLAFVGILSFFYRKKSFTLVDEIKSGAYRGDRSDQWKGICKWAIKRADFKIVNDTHRVKLLSDYASLNLKDKIIIYPGCYVERPNVTEDRQSIKKSWGFPEDAFVIGSSGGFNLTAGADWLLDSLKELTDIYAVVQPLGVSPLSVFLMESLEYSERLFIQKKRLNWNDAWKTSIGFDIGLSIYTNPAPQFQKMGISSNRLCMFIAMGVPVIASKQESFKFLEDFQCGILVESYREFKMAVKEIRTRHASMKINCEKCFHDYIKSKEYFNALLESIHNLSSEK
jgi:hypothetical protein